MGLLDKAKAAAQEAAAKAKDTAQDLQAKKDLFQAYQELGQKTFELADSGELTHPQLDDQIAKIRSLKAEVADSDGAAPAEKAGAAASDQPPAMPT